MSLRATLFVLLSSLSFVKPLTLDTNVQCPLVTETYTGPGFWLPTASAVTSTTPKASAGSWNGVLGQPDASNHDQGSGYVYASDAQPVSKGPSRITNWGNWDAQPTLPAFVETTQLNGNFPQGYSSWSAIPTSASFATTKNIVAGEPFILYINDSLSQTIKFITFVDNNAVVCNVQDDATILVINNDGQLITYKGHLFVGPSNASGTTFLTLLPYQSPDAADWSISPTSLQASGASFCLESGPNQNIQMVFGQVPTDCIPVEVACDKYCALCTSVASTTDITIAPTMTGAAAASTVSANSSTQASIVGTTSSKLNATASASSNSTVSVTTSLATNTTSSKAPTSNSTSTVSNSTTAGNSTIPSLASLGIFSSNTTTDENGTTTAISGPIDLGSAPQVQLGPLSPPDIDIGSLDRFVAQPGSNLWFGASSDNGTAPEGAVTVRVAMNYTYPSIVLDHSIYIADISCTSTSISGSINNTVAFQKAQSEWTQNPLLFITSTPSCVPDGESAFFMVASDVTFNTASSSFVVSGTAADISDVVEDLGIDFGNIDYTTPTSNNTALNSTTSASCPSPSSPVIQGLPAASCGPNFDTTLNDALGYYSANGDEQYVLSAAAPGAASLNTSASTRRKLRRSAGKVSTIAEAHLTRRKGGKISKVFHEVGHAIEKGAKEVAHAVSTGVSQAATHVANAVKSDVSTVLHEAAHLAVAAVKLTIHLAIAVVKNDIKILKALVTGDYSNTFHIPIKMGPKEAVLVDSPWGDAFKVLEWKPHEGTEKFNVAKTALDKIASSLVGEPNPEPGVELYCVNCNVTGKFAVTGSISATPKSGWKKATLDMTGGLEAGLFIGINAFAQYEKNYEIVLFTQALPGWEIPGIVALGPLLSLGVSADLNISAQGQLMTGAKLTWNAMSAHLDFLNHANSSQSGWKPTVDHQFDVAGTLGAEAGLGLAVELGVGILVLKKYGRSIALRDTPAIAAHTTLAADYNVTTGATVGNDECPGIEWSVGFENKVTLGFKKQTKKGKEEVELEDGPTYTLADWEAPPLAEGCIKLGKGGGSDKESGEEKPVEIPANDTCSYWAGGKQWSDPRSNNWVFLCDVAATQLNNRRLINQFNSTSMLDCFATCHFDNQQCEQAVFLQDKQKCGWLVTATCDPTDAACAASGSMLTTCTAGVDCPIIMAQTFDAVSTPISPFTIYSASYKQIDVTSQVQQWWNKGHWISTQYVDLLYRFPQIGDPAPGAVKTYYMFYSYNGEFRSLASKVTAKYNIQAGSIQYPQAQRVTPDPEVYRLAAVSKGYSAASWLRIYDFNFGAQPLPTNELPKIMDYWYSHLSGATQIEIQLAAFDNYDSYYGTNKAGAVYFSSFVKAPGVISYGQNTEGNYIQESVFNPPASATKRSYSYPRWNRRDDNTTSTSEDTSTLQSVNATSSNNSTTDLTFAILTDSTGDLTLQLGTDGNLWLSTADVSSDDIANFTTGEYLVGVQQPSEQILGDSAGNLLHYFPDELSVTGASRLRLAPWNKLPRSSKIVSLVNMNGTDADDSTVVAVDTEGNYAWVWVCTYADQLNRVFVSNSAMGSNSTLSTTTAEFTVTGGNVTECDPLVLTPNWDDGSS